MARHKEISFETTTEESDIIFRIVRRAAKMAKKYKDTIDHQSLTMDIIACHANGNPLDLAKLEKADDFNFAHDVFGIRNHMDRTTGRLVDCFVPRCSL